MIFASVSCFVSPRKGDAPLRLGTERECVIVGKETEVGVMDSGTWTRTAAWGQEAPHNRLAEGGGASQQLFK